MTTGGAHALEGAFDWARSRGLNKIIGPKGFTTFDGLGLLSKAWSIARPWTAYNLPHYPASSAAPSGFESAGEMVSATSTCGPLSQ